MSLLGGVNGWLPDRSAAFQRVDVASANLDRLDPDGFLSMQAKTMQAYQRKDAAASLRLSKAWAARDWGQSAQAANPTLPWPPVHAAALVRLGSLTEGKQIFDDLMDRQPAYDTSRVLERLSGTDPRFIEGRDRLISSLREIGLR